MNQHAWKFLFYIIFLLCMLSTALFETIEKMCWTNTNVVWLPVRGRAFTKKSRWDNMTDFALSPQSCRPAIRRWWRLGSESCIKCDKYDVSYLEICWLRVCDQILIHKCDRWWWIANHPRRTQRELRRQQRCQKVCSLPLLVGSPSYVMALFKAGDPEVEILFFSPFFVSRKSNFYKLWVN